CGKDDIHYQETALCVLSCIPSSEVAVQKPHLHDLDLVGGPKDRLPFQSINDAR
ncbi:hypothetical protein Tco_0576973, partial [Tanacetum coccineum]